MASSTRTYEELAGAVNRYVDFDGQTVARVSVSVATACHRNGHYVVMSHYALMSFRLSQPAGLSQIFDRQSSILP
jgi:hypothetical protein